MMKLSLVVFVIFGVCFLSTNALPEPGSATGGGWKDQDKNDPKVQEYAKLSLKKLEEQSSSKGKLNLVEVMQASKLNAGGERYNIKLKVADSKGKSKICNVQVEKRESKEATVPHAACE